MCSELRSVSSPTLTSTLEIPHVKIDDRPRNTIKRDLNVPEVEAAMCDGSIASTNGIANT